MTTDTVGVTALEAKYVKLFNKHEIQIIVSRLARELNLTLGAEYQKKIVFVGILKGCMFFLSDLLRSIHFECDYELITAKSYLGQESTGIVSVDAGNLQTSMKDKIVVLVDEICDTGRTLVATKLKMQQLGAAKVYTCVLLNKQSRRVEALELDFIGAEIENHFAVGYGLDDEGKSRNLPYIHYKQEV